MKNYRKSLNTEILRQTWFKDFIYEKFNLKSASITPLGGYSNMNYSITDLNNNHYVLRVSSINRSSESLTCERHVLRSLEQKHLSIVPKLINKSSDSLFINYFGIKHSVCLFEKIPGKIDCLWWEECSDEKISKIFSSLAKLHLQMSDISPLKSAPVNSSSCGLPLQIYSISATKEVKDYLLKNWKIFCKSAEILKKDIDRYFPWKEANYQWIHGDIQMENIIFKEDEVAAFIDFESVKWDGCEKDAIFSAFRVCRKGKSDESFEYNANHLKISLNQYLKENPYVNRSFFSMYDSLWKFYYCLDQAILYLKNALEGVWTLSKGIGFLPCFKEVILYKTIY